MSEDSRPGANGSRVPDAVSVWAETVRLLPVGTRITGEVTVSVRFGVFLSIDGHPDAVGLAEIGGKPRCMELPAVGERVSGEVLWHTDHNHQVKIVLDEWVEHRDLLPRFRVGQIVGGRMVEFASIGVFLHLDDCFTGLVALTGPTADFRAGQEMAVRIMTVNHEQNEILLAEPIPPGRGAGWAPPSLSRARHESKGTA